jgi:hypothetical protein
MGFLAGKIYVHGHEFGLTKPSGFILVAIYNQYMYAYLALRIYTCTSYLYAWRSPVKVKLGPPAPHDPWRLVYLADKP